MTVTVDNYTRILLTVISVLLLALTVGLWYETPSVIPTAQAGIPDSGQQLEKLILKADEINASLAKISVLLTSGKVKVQVLTAEQLKAKPGSKSLKINAGTSTLK